MVNLGIRRPAATDTAFRAQLGAGLALLLLASCTTTNSRSANAATARPSSPWLLPSPLLAQQIEEEASRLPWTHDLERVEQIRWFVSVGEPAYPKLLALAGDARDDVAAAALAALGATGDRRLVESLRAVPWPAQGRGSALDLELARARVSLGDWSGMPVLIAALRDERGYTRTLSFQALSKATKQSFGYDPRGAADSRETAVLEWEAWWLSRANEGMLARP